MGGGQTYREAIKHTEVSSKHMGVAKHTVCVQTYGGVQTYRGHPNICGASKHMGAIQTYRRATKHTEETSKHKGEPNTLGNIQIWRCLNLQGDIPTGGGTPTYGWHLNIWACWNIQGSSKHMGASKHKGASKHMGISKHTGGIQTYVGHPSIWRHPKILGCINIQGTSKNMGASKDTRGNPNIQGTSKEAHPCHGASLYHGFIRILKFLNFQFFPISLLLEFAYCQICKFLLYRALIPTSLSHQWGVYNPVLAEGGFHSHPHRTP